jgi:hypothetical protein
MAKKHRAQACQRQFAYGTIRERCSLSLSVQLLAEPTGAIVRQAVERSRTDDRHPRHDRGIDVFPGCKLHIRVAESVERKERPPNAANMLVATRHERFALFASLATTSDGSYRFA